MATIKPYRMKVVKPPKLELPNAPILSLDNPLDDPPLEGYWGDVQLGSEEQERLLRGLSKLNKHVEPEYYVNTPYSIPGQGKRIDIIDWDIMLPIEVDSIFHTLETSKAQDAERDALLNDILRPRGFQPIKRVDGARFLQTQDDADALAAEL